MTARTGPSELDLIPWDFTSEEHTQRAYLQRVSCGWRWDEVQDWVENCKAGKMMVYWLVIPDSVSDRDSQIAAHVSRYPKESSPITDTAPQSWQSRPRTPSHKQFIPIGHVGITIPPASVLQQLSLPHDTAVAYVGKLYVSYALQGHGYGGATMRAVEALARHQLGAQMCVLDCIVHDYQMRPDVLEVFYVRHGNPAPKISNEQWYRKLGYEYLSQDDKGYLHTHFDTRKQEYLPVSYFKKMLK